MDWKSPRGITYLASAKVECPQGQILQKLVFKQENRKKFRYTYECVIIADELQYETVTNEWSNYLGESEDLGDVNLLTLQGLDCYGKGFLTSVIMEFDLMKQQIRYVYKCGQILNLVEQPTCDMRSTQMHTAEGYFLPTLEHHGIKCRGEELLSFFQLYTDATAPEGLIWYRFECCVVPVTGNFSDGSNCHPFFV